MSTQRDELATTIGEQFEHPAGPFCPICAAVRRAVDALIADSYTKPRTITTVEELDALPVGSVVIDGHGDVCERFGNGWTGIIKERLMDSWLLVAAEDLPLDCTVLFEPTP